MKKDEDDLLLIHRVLEAAGLEVEPIPEAETERCDLRARKNGERYLVEVKGLHDSEDIRPTLTSGDVYFESRAKYYSSAVENRIREAMRQIRTTASLASGEFRLVAVRVLTRFSPIITEWQILGTLYGIREVWVDSEPGTVLSRRCLYAAESLFFRHKELDGVIVIGVRDAMMCLNDYGTRLPMLQDSSLARFFRKSKALNEASTLEHSRGFLVADCAIDRKDEEAVRGYLKTKYNLGCALMLDPAAHSAMCRVQAITTG